MESETQKRLYVGGLEIQTGDVLVTGQSVVSLFPGQYPEGSSYLEATLDDDTTMWFGEGFRYLVTRRRGTT